MACAHSMKGRVPTPWGVCSLYGGPFAHSAKRRLPIQNRANLPHARQSPCRAVCDLHKEAFAHSVQGRLLTSSRVVPSLHAGTPAHSTQGRVAHRMQGRVFTPWVRVLWTFCLKV